MLVSREMTPDPKTTTVETPVVEAQSLMRREKIHHLPVVDGSGRLVGIVTEKDLIYASPSPATSLSVYELNYLLAKLTVGKVMTRKVVTVTEDTALEEAARLMADNDIGGLPVVRDGKPVGIITETDIFNVFVELFAARDKGVRITAYLPDVRGELARLSAAIAEGGGNILAFGTVHQDDPKEALCAIKVAGIPKDKLLELVKPYIDSLLDVRET